MKSAIQYHEADIVKIRGAVSKHEQQLKSQAEQIKELQTKKENEDKREQQKRLIVTGLNEEEPKKHFITTVKEKLNIDITETDFSLETKEIRIRPRQNENARQSTSGSTGNEATNTNMQQRKKIVTLNFASTWKKREIYAARSDLRGTDIFLSEDIDANQRALFFKCRQLRRNHKIQQTWTQDLKIYVKANNNNKTEITCEADLDALSSHPISPPPHHDMTQFSTPMYTPTRRLSLRSNESEAGSFHGFQLDDIQLYWLHNLTNLIFSEYMRDVSKRLSFHVTDLLGKLASRKTGPWFISQSMLDYLVMKMNSNVLMMYNG